MRQVIDGRVYDTEKATKVDSYSYGLPKDFEYVEEALYKTAKGNYFLAGEGGARSKYGRSLGNNSYGGGAGITALTPDEALEWLEEHSEAEIIEREFPDRIEEA